MRYTPAAVWLPLALLAVRIAEAEPPKPVVTIPNCRISVIRRASLSGERQGILEEVSVSEGDVVEQGQIVARLRNEPARRALAIAQKEAANTVELRLSKKISELATLEYSKASELNRTIPGGFSEIDVKKLRLAAEKALLQIEQADYQLQMAALKQQEAESLVNSYLLRAPFAGAVLQVYKQTGEAISLGEPALEIANFDVMRVEGFVPLESVRLITRSADVTVELTSESPRAPHRVQRFPGRIKYVAPLVNEVSQDVRVWAEVENRDGLLMDGLSATMHVRPAKKPAAETAKTP